MQCLIKALRVECCRPRLEALGSLEVAHELVVLFIDFLYFVVEQATIGNELFGLDGDSSFLLEDILGDGDSAQHTLGQNKLQDNVEPFFVPGKDGGDNVERLEDLEFSLECTLNGAYRDIRAVVNRPGLELVAFIAPVLHEELLEHHRDHFRSCNVQVLEIRGV